MTPVVQLADAAPEPAPAPYRRRVLVAGIIGRTWLWFVAACLVITLLPILIGWRPFVVETGSMEPRINPGDVVLASPDHDADDLLGRVTVFTDPSRRDRTVAHRVVAVNADGTLQTKGDANPTPDSTAVPMDDVQGLGRLLVKFVGLPVVWAATGQWLWIALLVASLVLASWAAARDREDDEPEDDEDDDSDGTGDPAALPPPTRLSSGGSSAIAASTPELRQALAWLAPGARVRAWAWRSALAALVALSTVIPGANAAFSASTRSPANAWASDYWNYAGVVTDLDPWLYWRLDETSGATVNDSSGNNRNGVYSPSNGWTRNVTGALVGQTPNRAVTSSRTNSCIYTASSTTMNAPAQLTEVVWFKTNTTQGGKLVGFELPLTGVAEPGSGGTYDRHIYMDGNGRIWFGVYNGGYFTVSSSGSYNDNQWHMAAASLGSNGMRLYVDGVLQDTDANSVGESTTGWFRAGCGNLGGWGGSWTGANNPTTSTSPTQNRRFAGSLDEISIWQSVLSQADISAMWAAR